MKLINKTSNNLSHLEGDKYYFLAVGKIEDVPEEIAKIWLKINGVEKYVSPADLERAKKEAEEKAKAEKKALEEENAKLKKQLEATKEEDKPKKTTKKKAKK